MSAQHMSELVTAQQQVSDAVAHAMNHGYAFSWTKGPYVEKAQIGVYHSYSQWFFHAYHLRALTPPTTGSAS